MYSYSQGNIAVVVRASCPPKLYLTLMIIRCKLFAI
jgi:hypothetical protein